MNAPAPGTTESREREHVFASRCTNTELAVPECSCVECVVRLMHAYAPALLSAVATR